MDFATSELRSAQQLTDRVVDAVGEPVLAALLLGKAATAHERGVLLEIDPSSAAGQHRDPGRRPGDHRRQPRRQRHRRCAGRGGAPGGPGRAPGRRGPAEILVEDTGPGLSENDLMHAYDRGWTTKESGRPAADWGWRWSARPCAATAAGTVLPARAGRRVPGDAAGARTGAGRAVIRVLVVEDEPVAAEAHETVRRPHARLHHRRGRRHGRAALEALRRTAVDLVLLDMNLPDTHGIELCRRIRGAGVDVDVLAVTSARELTTVRAAAAVRRRRLSAQAVHLSGAARPTPRLRRLPGTGDRWGRRHGPGGRRARAGHGADQRAVATAQGHGTRHPGRRRVRRPQRRRAVGGGGRRTHRRVADHRPPVPGVPDRGRPGRPAAPIRGAGRPEHEYRWR